MNIQLARDGHFNPERGPCPQADEPAAMMAAIAAGDQRALVRLYNQAVSQVYGLALRITRRRETAEEVTEDVFVQVWHTAARYSPLRGTPMGWVLTICRSRAIDALRRTDTAICDPDPTERADTEALQVPGLQDLLQCSQQHAELHAAIRRLQPLQRQLLSLAFFRGMTHQELAEHMHMPLGSVKSHLRRTLARLRQELG